METKEYYGTKRVTAWPGNQDGRDGYRVQYADGYVSWSPTDVFEAAYQPITAMNFGHALQAMRDGHKVARAGWNGKGMWICQGEGNPRNPALKFWNKHTREFAEQNGGYAPVLPYFIMKTAGGEILMGWLASQSDMLADDWGIVE